MKFSNTLKRIVYTLLGVMLLVSMGGCQINRDIEQTNVDATLKFDVQTKSLLGTFSNGVTVNTIRIVVVHAVGNDVLFNKSTHEGTLIRDEVADGQFTTTLKMGSYRLYVIGNETPAMTTAFAGVYTKDAVESLVVNSPLIETDIVIYGYKDITVRERADSPGLGEVSTDGGLRWNNSLPVEVERVATKISLSISKNTVKPSDTFTVKQVEIINLPQFSYMNPKPYWGDIDAQKVLYSDPTGIKFTDNTPEVFTPVGGEVIIPEYLPSPNTAQRAVTMIIRANYNGQDVLYTVPLRGNLDLEDYSLLRNKHYTIRLTITHKGSFDYNPYVEYEVLEWTDAGGNNYNIDNNITFTGKWATGTVMASANEAMVYVNEFVEFRFILNHAVGSTWTASLSNGVNFEFDYLGNAVSSGSTQTGIEYIIRIKPKAAVSSNVHTEFFITVNNGVRNIEIDLNGSSSTGPANRYVITEISQ